MIGLVRVEVRSGRTWKGENLSTFIPGSGLLRLLL